MIRISDIIYRIKRRILLWANAGGECHCSICGFRAKTFGIMGRSNEVIDRYKIIGAGERFARCLNCRSIDRERMVHLFLKESELWKDPRDACVLHVAPEPALAKLLQQQKFRKYVRIDRFSEGYTFPKGVLEMDLCETPFENDSFDLILCSHVLEHIEDDLTAMKELYRILKKGGMAILQVPTSPILTETMEDQGITTAEQREAHFGQPDHVRIYGSDYGKRLEGAGFRLELQDLSAAYPNEGLYPGDPLMVCFK